MSTQRLIPIVSSLALVALFLLPSGLVAFASNSSSSSSSLTFSTPVNLSSNDGSKAANFPWVTNIGSNVYVAWTEGGGGLRFRSSLDGGTTWSPALTSPSAKLSIPGGTVQAPIVCANGSDVYVAWSQTVGKTGLQVFVAASTNHGASFSKAKQLSSGSPHDGWITPVCAAAESYAYVAWINDSPNQSWVSSSDDNGATWSVPFNYGHTREPEAAALNQYGYIYSNRDLTVTNNGGSTWKTVLLNLTLRGDEGQIAAAGPNVYITTQTKTPTGYIHLYYSNDYAQPHTFHNINDSTPTLPDSWEPMVAAYGDSAWFALIDHPGGPGANIYVYTTHNGGTTWSAPVSVSGTGHDDNYPFTVSSSDGQNVFVGFTQEVSSNYWVFRVGYSADGGNTWTPAPGLDVSQNSQGKAAFQNDLATGAISSFGSHCYATWEFVSGSGHQVQFSHS